MIRIQMYMFIFLFRVEFTAKLCSRKKKLIYIYMLAKSNIRDVEVFSLFAKKKIILRFLRNSLTTEKLLFF